MSETKKPISPITIGAGCLILGGAIGGLAGHCATKSALSSDNGSSVTVASASGNAFVAPAVFVPGWMAERTFHNDAILCPWTENPLNDTDCQFRQSEINRIRNAISLCPNPLARNMETIGHRGAALVAPEETIRSWQIAVDSGAAIVECDASVTKDLDFMCRHGTCDLQFTTDILTRPDMVAKCSQPFAPAGNGTRASVLCCTFDFTVEEMGKLCATMENVVNDQATRIEEYVIGKPAFRSIGFAKGECVQMATMREYLAFAKSKAVNVIPELKDTTENATQVFLAKNNKDHVWLADKFASYLRDAGFTTPFDKDFKEKGKKGTIGIMQTFDRRVAKAWKQNNKDLSVLYLLETPMNITSTEKDCATPADCGSPDVLRDLIKAGVEIISPAMNGFVDADPATHRYVEHQYSKDMKAIVKELNATDRTFFGSWSLERSGCVSQLGNATYNAEAGLGSIGG
ncbi:PLC-like phosphodiesterase, partial [Chytriomyces sp. MP71]